MPKITNSHPFTEYVSELLVQRGLLPSKSSAAIYADLWDNGTCLRVKWWKTKLTLQDLQFIYRKIVGIRGVCNVEIARSNVNASNGNLVIYVDRRLETMTGKTGAISR